MATDKRTKKEELDTMQHFEFIGDHDGVSEFDFRVAAAFGAINRGISRMRALRKYNLTEDEYDKNIKRVLKATW